MRIFWKRQFIQVHGSMESRPVCPLQGDSIMPHLIELLIIKDLFIFNNITFQSKLGSL